MDPWPLPLGYLDHEGNIQGSTKSCDNNYVINHNKILDKDKYSIATKVIPSVGAMFPTNPIITNILTIARRSDFSRFDLIQLTNISNF